MPYPIIENPHVIKDLNQYLIKISEGGWNLFEAHIVGETINYNLTKIGRVDKHPEFLAKYINEYPNSREPDAEDLDFISKAQDYIPHVSDFFTPGQVLFHGGSWPRTSSSEMRCAFVTDRLLSTSFSAEVAINHVLNPNMRSAHPDVWVLTVKESPCPSGALMLPYQGDFRHELESIFEVPTLICMKSQKKINKINYIFADLY